MKPWAVGLILAGLSCLVFPEASELLALDPQKEITQYIHNVWEVQDGLPNNTVSALIQTRDGYLWIGTENGLARFDGSRFTLFNKGNTTGIPNNFILALYEDFDGNLWIGTYGGGLVRFKDGKFSATSVKNGLPNDVVMAICQDRKGALWIGTSGGLTTLWKGKLTTYTSAQGLSHVAVGALYADKEGNVWIGTRGGGLNRYRDGAINVYTTQEGLSDNRVLSIYEDSHKNLWVGTFAGLDRFMDGKFTRYTTADGLPHNTIWSVLEDRQGNLWLGTSGGLCRYQAGKFTTYGTRDGLLSDFTGPLYEDREGSLWVGTMGGGLNNFQDGKFTSYDARSGLTTDPVWSVLEDTKGNVWIATSSGLTRFKDGKFTTYTTSEGLSSNILLSIYEAHDGTLWVGADGGLNRLKDGKWTTYGLKDGLSNNVVYSMHEDRTGTLWIGTYRGLNCWKDGKFTVPSINQKLSMSIVYAIHEDTQGNIWIGTRGGGLERIRNGVSTTYGTSQGLAGDIVFTIYEDSDGTLWIGTDSGLSRLKNGQFTTISARNGLFDDSVYQILEDSNGKFWIGSAKGVVHVGKKELEDFAEGRTRSIRCVPFGTADGMKSVECSGGTQPSGWKARDGRLWFATSKGVAVIDPNSLQMTRSAPPVVIQQMIVNGRVVEPASESILPAGTKNLEFHYAGLTFLSPERVQFRYMLENFENEWIEAGNRRVAFYTNIPPGSYRFRVTACNSDEVWNQTGASLSFSLRPYFYQTRAFYGLLLFTFLFLGWTGYRLHEKSLERRNREQARRESEEQFRATAESASDAIVGFDDHGKIFVLNKSAERIFGCPAEKAAGRSFSSLIAESFRAVVQQKLADALLAEQIGAGAQTIELVGLRGDGTEFPAELSLSRWRRGGETFHTAIVRDITERKKNEEAMQAAARLEATSILAGGIAHRFNNLMFAVMGNVEILGIRFSSHPEAVRSVAEISKLANQASELVQQLLAFARGGKYEPRIFNLNDIVRETLRLEQQKLHPEVELTHELESSLWSILADPMQIRQVLVNLIQNSVEATTAGGRIAVSTRNVTVDQPSRPNSAESSERRYVRLKVADSGCGMSPETKARIFEPFFTTKFMGRGLGLAAVYGIVRNHNGQIRVITEEGRGAAFEIDFPAAEGEIKKLMDAREAASVGSETVLVVDDDATVASVVSEFLKRLNYKVLVAANGREALETARDFDGPIDLVLLDMIMPVMSGPDAYPRLKELRPQAKVIITSGYEIDSSAQALLGAGADLFLRKPFRLETLAQQIRKVLGG